MILARRASSAPGIAVELAAVDRPPLLVRIAAAIVILGFARSSISSHASSAGREIPLLELVQRSAAIPILFGPGGDADLFDAYKFPYATIHTALVEHASTHRWSAMGSRGDGGWSACRRDVDAPDARGLYRHYDARNTVLVYVALLTLYAGICGTGGIYFVVLVLAVMDRPRRFARPGPERAGAHFIYRDSQTAPGCGWSRSHRPMACASLSRQVVKRRGLSIKSRPVCQSREIMTTR